MLDTKQHSYSLSVAFDMKCLCKRQLSNMSRCFVCITFKSRTPFLMSVCMGSTYTLNLAYTYTSESSLCHAEMYRNLLAINSVNRDLIDHVMDVNCSDTQKSRFLSRLRKFHKLQKIPKPNFAKWLSGSRVFCPLSLNQFHKSLFLPQDFF